MAVLNLVLAPGHRVHALMHAHAVLFSGLGCVSNRREFVKQGTMPSGKRCTAGCHLLVREDTWRGVEVGHVVSPLLLRVA